MHIGIANMFSEPPYPANHGDGLIRDPTARYLKGHRCFRPSYDCCSDQGGIQATECTYARAAKIAMSIETGHFKKGPPGIVADGGLNGG